MNIDYKQVGLACGLEIHQQLNTSKLFCSCPTKLIKEDLQPDNIFVRKLKNINTSVQEQTIKEQLHKNLIYKYYFYNKCNCLIESDSQPPKDINQEALKIGVVISKLTNSVLVDKAYVMRKHVLDGSNVSGFQRSVLISSDGYLDFDFGRVRIDKLFLEEDAARILSKDSEQAVYSLDRLGFPLIELVVWHDMHTPQQVKQVALFLGQLFRSTGKIKRGLGSIRQDINISIRHGARVEIKGCQDLDLIPMIIDHEILRQQSLIEIKNLLFTKEIKKFKLTPINITSFFKHTSSKIFASSLKNNKEVFFFHLPDFRGFLGKNIQPNKRLGGEISNYLKVKTTLNGLFHLDELPNTHISQEQLNLITSSQNLKKNDSFILVISDAHEIQDVKNVIENRLNDLFKGVLEETRMVTQDGNTEYQRPLSSHLRMYPETDLLPIDFSEDFLKNVYEHEMPLSIQEREKLYLNKFKLNKQISDKMLLNNHAPIFEKILENININPTFLAVFLLEDLVKGARDGKLELDEVTHSVLQDFFINQKVHELVSENKLLDIFCEYLNSPRELQNLLKKYKKNHISDAQLIFLINECFEKNKEFILVQKERAFGFLMSELKRKTNHEIDAKNLAFHLKTNLSNFLEKNKGI